MLTSLQIQTLQNAVQRSPFSHIYMEQLWWNAPEALSTTEYESILSRTQVDEKFVVDSAVTLSGKSDVASLEMYTAIKSSEREVLSSREQEDATSREKDLDSLLNSL